jgi:transcriptional antiterminator RfaH
MFPRYVFFRPSRQEQSISTVRSTRGVNSVLTFGASLAVIQHEVLQTIRCRELQRNQAQADIISPFQPGSHVRFRDPVYQKLEGLVQSVSAQRVVLLLEILGRQKMIQVHHDQVELA